MAVKCAAKSLLEREQWLQRGVWEQILRKAQRTTSIQRVISSNCSAIEPSHLKNAATVSKARWIRPDSAWVEVRWMVRLRPLSTILPMIDMYAGRDVIASRWASGSASRQNMFHQLATTAMSRAMTLQGFRNIAKCASPPSTDEYRFKDIR